VRRSSGAPTSENLPDVKLKQLFLDRNLRVSFHKPTMKAADGKVSHAQSRACSAA
jgi:hypothetical protein